VTVLVSVETLLLVLLVVLVAGLLRSHAEILRRLGPPGADPPALPTSSEAPNRTGADPRAAPVTGPTPAGDTVRLAFDGGAATPTLLAFLSTGCSTCGGFWETLGEHRLPAEVQTVIVTQGSERESASRLRSLAPSHVPVVMSSQAWQDYGVPGAPYFVLVDRAIRGEGVATTWSALASLVTDAVEDQREAGGAGAISPTSRARRLDATFAAAGIAPDDPSLYPGRPASSTTERDGNGAQPS
jgi:hypothetical protein